MMIRGGQKNGLLCYNFLSNTLILLPSIIFYLFVLLLPKDGGAFPLSRRLLNDFDNVHAMAANPPSQSSNTDRSSIASRLHHFRLRHERRRMNRVKEALVYLRKFGYLSKGELSEETVQDALKSVQQVLGVRTSGELDRQTISGMRMPRCGNADVEQPRSKRLRRFAQMSRWLNKMDDQDVLHLQWYIEKYTKDIPRDSIRDVIKRAFKLWSDQVTIQSMRTLKLDFMEASNLGQSDISIMWAEGDHGDAYPFDGPGNTTNILAHTFYPNYQETGSLNGDIHFDDYETWILDNANQEESGVRFPYVLVHEIGHALGLGHSRRQEAVMNPIYKQTPLNEITLDIDDKCAVNWNYIGPTRTCLFIWLLIEYLPRAQETNTSHGFGVPTNSSGMGPGSFYSHAVGEQTVDDRVRKTFDNLQRAPIPQCTPDNDLQTEYEILLMTKLEFPRDSARRYAPVVCNFLDGLQEMLARRRISSTNDAINSISNSNAPETAQTVEQQELIDDIPLDTSRPAELRVSTRPLVHSYSSSPFASQQYSSFHSSHSSTIDSSSDTSSSSLEEVFSLQRESPDGDVVDVYSRNYFDEQFFYRLVRLVVSSRNAGHSQMAQSSTPPSS